MNEELNEILNQIRNAVNEIETQFTLQPIYNSRNGRNRLGKEAVYSREISKGISLRLVNDGSYSIGGTATKEEKETFLGKLKEILSQNSKDVPVEIKDMVYPIVDALEESIKSPERDAEIVDVPLPPKPQEPKPPEQEPVVTPTPEPTKTPEPTPVVTSTPEPIKTSEPTPVVTSIPEPIKTPEPTPVVTSTPEPTPVATPTPVQMSQMRKKDLILINAILKNYEDCRDGYQNIDIATLSQDDEAEIARKIMFLNSEMETFSKLANDLNDQNLSDSEYEEKLLAALKQSRDFINSILFQGNNSVEKLDSDLMKSFDIQLDRMSLRIEEIEAKKQEKNKPQQTSTPGKYEKEVAIIFDAETGKYDLFEGDNVILSIDAENVYGNDDTMDNIYSKICKITGEKISDVEECVDPVVYSMLAEYDKSRGTNYAKKFLDIALNGIEYNDEELPFELGYILAKPRLSLKPPAIADGLSIESYKMIKKYAKDYNEMEIADIEYIEDRKQEEENDESKEEDDGSKKSLWQSLKDLGTSILTAVVNFGLNVKDVFTGKKTIKQLFTAPFKSVNSGNTRQIGSGEEEREEGESEPQPHKGPEMESRLFINTKISSIIRNATKDVKDDEERATIERQTIENMAKARGIDINDQNGNPKPMVILRGEIRDYEAVRYENNKVGYVLPEEIGEFNEPPKEKSDSREPEKEPTGGQEEK